MQRILWSDVIKRTSLGLMALAMVMGATGVRLAALTKNAVGTPEIDGTSLAAGLGLLGAGLLWLRARRKVK